MKSTNSGHGLIVLGILAIALGTWTCADLLDGLQQDSHLGRSREELWDNLSFLHSRGNSAYLARERLLSCIQGMNEISDATAETLSKRIQEAFDGQAQLFATDGKGKQLITKGYEPDLQASLSLYLEHRARKEEGREVPYNITQDLMSSMEMGLFPGDQENRMEIARILFRNSFGWFLSGVFVRQEGLPSMEYQKKINDHFKESKLVSNQCSGRIAIFVPESLYLNPDWFRKTIQKPPPDFTWNYWAGPPGELASHGRLPIQVRDLIRKKMETNFEDIVETDEWLVGFVRLLQPRETIQVCYSARSYGGRPSRSPGVLAITFLALLTFLGGLFLMTPGTHRWGSPILHKFLLFCVFACLIPLLGLTWMNADRDDWENDLFRISANKSMEQEISRLEDREQLVESEIVTRTKMLLSPSLWFSKPLTEKSFHNRYLLDLMDQRFNIFFLIHRRVGKFIAKCAEAGYSVPTLIVSKGDTSMTPIEVFLDGLLFTLAEIMGFPVIAGGASDTDRLKIGILLDSLRESPEAFSGLNNIGLEQDVLSTSRALQSETTWTFLHISRDRMRNPLAIFFLAFSRKWHQRKLFFDHLHRISRLGTEVPSMVLLWTPLFQTSPVIPDHLSLHPVIQQILFQLTREGGLQRMTLRIQGRNYLSLARPLKNLDVIALALRPIPDAKKGFRKISGGTLGIAYLISVIALIGWLFRTNYLGPLLSIHSEVIRISEGDYEIRLPVVSGDELGTLSKNFNKMAAGLKEKEYLTRFLSDLAMENVKQSERLPATRIQATILFSDIRGFTTLSESLSPEIMVDMLNQHMTRMEEVIKANGGSIDKFIGDAIMAVFLPLHGQPNSASRAVKAGLEMMTALRRFNLERAATGLFQIKIGVGIATGQVLMGVLGQSVGRQDYTVTGSTVNQAAQMEKRTKEARETFVVVCQNTAGSLDPTIRLTPLSSTVPETAFEVKSNPGT